MAVTTSLFMSNTTQAVRLPKAVAFPSDVVEVEIIAVGASRIICPVGHRWDDFFASADRMSDDFMAERDQRAFDDRTKLFED